MIRIPSRKDRFLNAIVKGKNSKVQQLLKSHPELISVVDEYGEQPLIMAMRCPKADYALHKILIESGADTSAYVLRFVDTFKPYVFSPSYLAPRTGEIAVREDRELWERSRKWSLEYLSWLLSRITPAQAREWLDNRMSFATSRLSNAVRTGQQDLELVLRQHMGIDPKVLSERLVTLDGTEELLTVYWRHLAKEWWQRQTQHTALCDHCNCEIIDGNGFLIGSWLRCDDCTYRAVVGARSKLRENPDYFGPGMLENAKDYQRQSSTQCDP